MTNKIETIIRTKASSKLELEIEKELNDVENKEGNSTNGRDIQSLPRRNFGDNGESLQQGK